MWTEKHRPTRLSQIRGQDAPIATLRKWAESWSMGKPRQKAVLLYGPAGTGKTTAALALGTEMNWEVLEINASDKRSESALDEIARSSRTRFSFSGKAMKLLVIDEVDGLSGSEDRGGPKAISEIIRCSVNPIILICNDLYSPKLSHLRRIAKPIQFGRVRKDAIAAVLREISRKEGVQPDFLALNLLADRAEGDLRSAINDMETVSIGGKVSRQDVRVPEKRRTEGSIFRALDLIFSGYPNAADYARDLDLSPDQLLEWIAENLPLRYTDARQRAEAYEIASAADIYLSRVYRRMHWGFWGYATDMMTRGLGSLADLRAPGYDRQSSYSRPTDYMRIRQVAGVLRRVAQGVDVRSGSNLAFEAGIAREIGRRCHMSTKEAMVHLLPYLRIICENDPGRAEAILRGLGLDEENIARFRVEGGG